MLTALFDAAITGFTFGALIGFIAWAVWSITIVTMYLIGKYVK